MGVLRHMLARALFERLAGARHVSSAAQLASNVKPLHARHRII
jgi:hypothetical protein